MAVCGCLCFWQSAAAEEPSFPFPSDARLERARTARRTRQVGEAVRLLQRIVDENPGRQMAGAARLELAYLRELLQNRQEAIRIAEEVRSEFRDTPAGIQAEKYLICMRYSGRERRVRLDALIAYIAACR